MRNGLFDRTSAIIHGIHVSVTLVAASWSVKSFVSSFGLIGSSGLVVTVFVGRGSSGRASISVRYGL